MFFYLLLHFVSEIPFLASVESFPVRLDYLIDFLVDLLKAHRSSHQDNVGKLSVLFLKKDSPNYFHGKNCRPKFNLSVFRSLSFPVNLLSDIFCNLYVLMNRYFEKIQTTTGLLKSYLFFKFVDCSRFMAIFFRKTYPAFSRIF